MGDNRRDLSRASGTLEEYWFPNESFGGNREVPSEQTLGTSELMKMVDSWRSEREDILKNKEKQKKKALLKKKKILERKKTSDRERFDIRRGMESALRSTFKSRDSCDMLLAELEYYENEGHHIMNMNQGSQKHLYAGQNDSLQTLESAEHHCEAELEEKRDQISMHKILIRHPKKKSYGEFDICRNQLPKNFVHKKSLEEIFLRLKKQQEQEPDSCFSLLPPDDDYFQESFQALRNLYEQEMKVLNTAARLNHSIQFSYEPFPPFPSSIKELDFLSNNPLIIFREWCHFHKLSTVASDKIDVDSLLNDYTSDSNNDNIRLSSLYTLIQLYSEGYPIINEKQDSEVLLASHDLQTSSRNENDALKEALQGTLKNSYGKLKLGTALAIALTSKNNEIKETICPTLVAAVKGITSTEKRIAALAMAYAGIFEYSALHVILEEWKTAQQVHVLQKYLTALRWLSFHENSIIKSVAEYLTSRNLHFRLYVCLTLPFLEGNLPLSVRDMLIHLMRNSTIHVLRLAAARVLECKQRGDCVQEHIIASLSFSNIMRALEVIQLSLMLKHIDPKIAGILLPCLESEIKQVKMIGLSIIGKLQINNPIFIQAICNLFTEKDSEIRATAFQTLRLINAQGSQVESSTLSALVNETNEKVITEILKLIEETEIKGKATQKSLLKLSKKSHTKDNQQFILDLLQNISIELDDISPNKSPAALTAAEQLSQDARRSSASVSTMNNLSTMKAFSLENVAFIKEVMEAHEKLKTVSAQKFSSSSSHHFARTEEEKKVIAEAQLVQKNKELRTKTKKVPKIHHRT